MRKIEREMIQAIIDQRPFSKANTSVEHCHPGTTETFSNVYLHGHHIASYYHVSGDLLIAHAGWKTNTTKSRLNALIQFVHGGLSGLIQKNYQWYLRLPLRSGDTQDFEWSGALTAV